MIIRFAAEIGTSLAAAAMIYRVVTVSANRTLLLLWVAHITTLRSENIDIDFPSGKIKVQVKFELP
jgi:hypothetical protein